MRNSDQPSRERPAEGKAEGLLVLLHGRGGDENQLFPLADALDPARRLHCVCPRGRLTLPGVGWQWFDAFDLPPPKTQTRRESLGAASGSSRSPSVQAFVEGFHESLGVVSAWIDGLYERYGADRTILCGFSQGAIFSYALALARGRERPAGVVALAGFVPRVPGLELDLDGPLPRFAIGHGSDDDVIEVEHGRAARDLLEHAGADVLYGESAIGHTVDPAFVTELRAWPAATLKLGG